MTHGTDDSLMSQFSHSHDSPIMNIVLTVIYSPAAKRKKGGQDRDRMGIKQEEEECVFAQEDKTADPRKAGELWISSDHNISLSSDQHRKEVLQISTFSQQMSLYQLSSDVVQMSSRQHCRSATGSSFADHATSLESI